MGFAVANSVGSVAGFISPYLLGYVADLTGSTNNGVLFHRGVSAAGWRAGLRGTGPSS